MSKSEMPDQGLRVKSVVHSLQRCAPDFLEVGQACEYRTDMLSAHIEDHAGRRFEIDFDNDIWIRVE